MTIVSGNGEPLAEGRWRSVAMKARLRLVSLVVSLTLVGAACTAVPVATPAEGPSHFFDGFSLAAVVASINATPNGPRCPIPLAAGITAELRRLGAVEVMTGVRTTASGARFTDTWAYLSSGLRGQITVRVLAAPEGHDWVIVRIIEPS
jgi:hypothetical protein